MKSTARNLIISLAIVAGFAGAAFFLLARSARLPEHPLDRVPATAEAAIWMDVQAVLGSSLWTKFVTEAGEDEALRRLEERCGFDPLAQLENVTAFVTGAPQSLEHVGFVAEGPFDHEALAGCLRAAVEEDGGSLREVQIEGARAIASEHGPSRAAFVGKRGVVAGHEELVASTLRAVGGREGSLASDETIRRLWDRLAESRDIVAVGHIPDHWQQGLHLMLGTERANLLAPHLVELRTLGVGARVSRGFAATVVAVTSSEEAARDLGSSIRQGIARLTSNPFVAVSPVGSILSNIEARTDGSEVTIAMDITAERLERIMTFADRMANQLANAPEGGPPTAPPPTPPAPTSE